MLTGQLIFRDTDKPSHHEGHKLMMVCGIISVPNNWKGKAEHQYIITGCVDHNLGESEVHIHFDTEVDLTTELTGVTIGQLITSPLWRV